MKFWEAMNRDGVNYWQNLAKMSQVTTNYFYHMLRFYNDRVNIKVFWVSLQVKHVDKDHLGKAITVLNVSKIRKHGKFITQNKKSFWSWYFPREWLSTFLIGWRMLQVLLIHVYSLQLCMIQFCLRWLSVPPSQSVLLWWHWLWLLLE